MMKYSVSQPCLSALEHQLVNEVLERNQLTMGPMVARFESLLARYLDVPHVITTNNGTTALHLTLAAAGIGPGDEVLVPDLTFVASANAVRYTGADVVLVDVHPETWAIDVRDATRKVTSRTRAVLPVHLYGVPAPLDDLWLLAKEHKLLLIEDAAEGLGGNYHGCALGAYGHAGTFSFYGNKVITCGEGGAVTTRDGRLAEKLRFLRGQALDPKRRYYHPEVGFNYRLTDLQAAVGVGQMQRLPELLAARQEIMDAYRSRLMYHGDVPVPRPGEYQAPWLFTYLPTSRRKTRDELMVALATDGIETRPTFVPLHRMPMYLGHDDEFPVSSDIGDRGMSLPTHANLTLTDVDYICSKVVQWT